MIEIETASLNTGHKKIYLIWPFKLVSKILVIKLN